jgi:hypothetical protein
MIPKTEALLPAGAQIGGEDEQTDLLCKEE